jgi:hypothetical protein
VTARRALTRVELAQALDVSPRSIERWVRDGCPATRGGRGKLFFNLDEVRAWIDETGPTTDDDDRAGGRDNVAFSTSEKAELAGKIARARKTELEVSQEKNLKGLGLGLQIREANTYETLSKLTADVAAACAEGDLRPERANALHRLLVERRRQLTKLELERSEDPLGDKVLLCTAEAEDLVRAFEGLYSDARRERLLGLARDLLAEDLGEFPPTDTSPGAPPATVPPSATPLAPERAP